MSLTFIDNECKGPSNNLRDYPENMFSSVISIKSQCPRAADSWKRQSVHFAGPQSYFFR